MNSLSPAYALKQMRAEHLDWHGARLSFLAHVLPALCKVKTVNLAEPATALNGRVKPEFHYQRLQRFVRDCELNFPQLARWVVKLMPLGDAPWDLTLDRTHRRFGQHEINILMLGIAYRGIAIPLLWTVLANAGHSHTAERIALMERFPALFGREKIAAVLADREVVGQARFNDLQRQQMAFRIRIKHNTLIPHCWNKPLRARVLFRALHPGEPTPGRGGSSPSTTYPFKKTLQRPLKSLFRHGFDRIRFILLNFVDQINAFFNILKFLSCT
jgi:hypothetical protein